MGEMLQPRHPVHADGGITMLEDHLGVLTQVQHMTFRIFRPTQSAELTHVIDVVNSSHVEPLSTQTRRGLSLPNSKAHGWNRTSDLRITKPLLYRLSYVVVDVIREQAEFYPKLGVLRCAHRNSSHHVSDARRQRATHAQRVHRHAHG